MKRYQYRMTLHELCDRMNTVQDIIRGYETQIHLTGPLSPSAAMYLQGHKKDMAELEKRAARRKDYRRVVLGQ